MKNNIKNEITIFPTPVKDKLTVSLPVQKNNIIYSVYNANGKLILKDELKEISIFELDLSNQAKGIYFIHLLVDKEKSVIEIIKQ